MEQNKKVLLNEQANKIEDVLNVLRTRFGGDYEDVQGEHILLNV